MENSSSPSKINCSICILFRQKATNHTFVESRLVLPFCFKFKMLLKKSLQKPNECTCFFDFGYRQNAKPGMAEPKSDETGMSYLAE